MTTETSGLAASGREHGAALREPLRLERSCKRGLDIGIASLSLGLLVPLLLIVYLLVRMWDGGPVLVRHRRLGKGGRPFYCLKFRTMVVDAEGRLNELLEHDPMAQREWAEQQKLTHDPRVTSLGQVLRNTSVDELPQLVNVLKGEMSLVGPRPIVPDESAHYGEAFERCFSVPPGITGLWQVSGRNNCTYAERVSLDLRYATEWRLWTDLVILLRTVPAVLCQRGSR
jgi:exopolysaccharide production protein ExoY